MTLSLLLPYPPSTNRLWRQVRGRMVLSAAALAWKATATWQARLSAQAQRYRAPAGPVEALLILHPRLTKAGKPSQVRLDVDGPIKIALDALQGVAYANDKQVTCLTARVGAPLPEGGLTVQVKAMDEEAKP